MDRRGRVTLDEMVLLMGLIYGMFWVYLYMYASLLEGDDK
jgi:hypothetical protein